MLSSITNTKEIQLVIQFILELRKLALAQALCGALLCSMFDTDDYFLTERLLNDFRFPSYFFPESVFVLMWNLTNPPLTNFKL